MVAILDDTRELVVSQLEMQVLVYKRTMLTIEEIHKGAQNTLLQLGRDWIANHLDPESTFRITPPKNDPERHTETFLNYLIWYGLLEKIHPIFDVPEGWRLTPKGKSRVIALLRCENSPKPPPPPTPSSGRHC
jgi:hypothetical protein